MTYFQFLFMSFILCLSTQQCRLHKIDMDCGFVASTLNGLNYSSSVKFADKKCTLYNVTNANFELNRGRYSGMVQFKLVHNSKTNILSTV